jgi:dihydroorotate dehydrogenase (NAD+) catalytic subunit
MTADESVPRGAEAAPVSLETRLGPVELRNPVLVASGTFAAGREGSRFVELASLGGIIVKSMTLAPWRGRPTPRMCETPSGMLNAIGIQNRGVDYFLAQDLPWLLKRDAAVFASIAGNTVEEFVKVADKLRTGGRRLAGVEVNISCPNLEDRANIFAHSRASTAAVVGGVKRALPRLAVFAKLSPNVTSLVDIAEAALEAGADGLSLINTVFGMAIDVRSRRPKLSSAVGGLSGPAIRPIAVRAVHEVHRAFPEVAIVGQGGVATAHDALELILAGASAVAVGTASFVDPTAATSVRAGIAEFMAAEGVGSVAELVGAVKLEG